MKMFLKILSLLLVLIVIISMTFCNVVAIKPSHLTTIAISDEDWWGCGLEYSRLLLLNHSKMGYNNILLATFEQLTSGVEAYKPGYPIYRSFDQGKHWEEITFVQDNDAVLQSEWMPSLFELSQPCGNYDEGTVFLVGSSIDNSHEQLSAIRLYASRDSGETFEQPISIAVAGGIDNGVWEPCLIQLDDGRLVCFYTDCSANLGNYQKIVYKVSEDGINWGTTNIAIEFDNSQMRPGMPVVTQLGDGSYFMVYEVVNIETNENQIFFSTSVDGVNWNGSKNSRAIVSKDGKSLGSAPYCAWSPFGGDDGTIVVSGKFMFKGESDTGTDYFISSDKGKTWTTMPHLIPYDAEIDYIGYSNSMTFSADGKIIYAINNPIAKTGSSKSKIVCAMAELVSGASQLEENKAKISVKGNNVIGTATEDVLTEFDYVSAEDAKVNASFDVADSTKKEVLNLNFNALEINSTVNSVNVGTGEPSYDGVAGVVATVLDNPARDGIDNCIVIGNYHHERFNVYDGSSYDATFWMQTNSLDWGIYNIQIKPDIYLAYRGAKHGDGGHRIGLYAGYSAVSNLPNSLVEAGKANRLAYIDLSEYGAYMSSNAYWRIVSTYNTVKVYVSSRNDFSNVEPVIDVVIPENYANERSILQFSQGNTGMWIDDVVVNEIGNTFNEDGKTLVKDVTFDGPIKGVDDIIYQHVSGDNYRMKLKFDNHWRTVSLYQGLSGYFSTEFYMAFSNNQWHNLDMSIRDSYALQFRGFSNMGTENNQLLIANNGAEIMRASIPDMTAGVYVKLEYSGTAIKVWVTAAPEFTGEYAATPTLELPLSAPLGDMTDWSFYRQDGEVIMDDIKITSSNGRVIYEEDFDGLGAFNPDRSVLRVDKTGNVTYVRGLLNEWADIFLFNAPENFEMTFKVHAVNHQWNSGEVFIKNDIGIFIKGTQQSGSGNREVTLQNGAEVLARYTVGSKESLGCVPFDDPGYIKAIFKGENLKVYMSKTEDFANEELIFDYTFSGLTTTSRAVRVVGKNDEMRYDNFKVYELKDDVNTSYKKLAISGNEMKLLNVSNGAATEISTYTLPFANAKYRVSVGKKDDKLTVYVDGKAVMETESGVEGLVYFEGATPKVKYGEVAPEILLAGDFDYNWELDATDLMTLRKVILGVDSSAYYMTTLNVNESVDGEVNILDLVRLKKLLVA